MMKLDPLPSERMRAFGPLIVRLVLGAHLVQGAQDNLLSWSRMLEFRDYLAGEGFPVPLASAIVSVGAQFGAGLCYLLGWQVRLAALVMLFNFAVALLVAHWGHPYNAWFPAWIMWTGSLALFFTGAGAWSLDARRRATP